jgi:hypothetical protein
MKFAKIFASFILFQSTVLFAVTANDSLTFHTKYKFNDFKCDVEKAAQQELNFNSNSPAQNYKTVIVKSYKAKAVNFAGHYVLISWGCGSPCQSGVIVDRLTGNIYDLPGASLGYSFLNSSRMLIVNPPSSTGKYIDCSYCKPEVFIWNDGTKKFENE